MGTIPCPGLFLHLLSVAWWAKLESAAKRDVHKLTQSLNETHIPFLPQQIHKPHENAGCNGSDQERVMGICVG